MTWIILALVREPNGDPHKLAVGEEPTREAALARAKFLAHCIHEDGFLDQGDCSMLIMAHEIHSLIVAELVR